MGSFSLVKEENDQWILLVDQPLFRRVEVHMLKRKDKILISAIELFDQEGITGVTTKNLARTQNVSEPALYRQYKGKQEILDGIIEEFASYDERIINTIKQSELSGVGGIRFYISRFAQLYQNYQELTTVMFSMDLYHYQETTRVRMKDIVLNRILFLEDLVEEGRGDMKGYGNFSHYEIASLINGTIFSQVYEWRMRDKSYDIGKHLVDYIDRLLEVN